MRIYNFLIVPFSLLLCNGNSLKDNECDKVKHEDETFTIQSSNRMPFESVKIKYDTLIPIFDSLFVTYYKIDSTNYFKYAEKLKRNSIEIFHSEDTITGETKKWGVIDSTGNVIIPFICDGVKAISENIGVVSVYSSSRPLNTGIPRFRYIGISYFFNKNGLLPETKKDFMITIEYFADNYNSAYVFEQGPTLYLPEEYRIGKRY